MPNNTSSHSKDLPVTRAATIPNPAPGANAAFTLDESHLMELVSLSFSVLTDANADNRIVKITITDGSETWILGSAAFAHTSSISFDYIAHQNAVPNIGGFFNTLMIPLPFARFLSGKYNFGITITDMNVGDQISDIQTIYNKWSG